MMLPPIDIELLLPLAIMKTFPAHSLKLRKYIFFSLEYFSIYVENSRNLIELVGEKKNFVCTIFLCRMHWLTNDGVHPTAVAAAMQTLRIGNRTSHFSPSFLRPTRACKIEYQRCKKKKKSILMLPAVVASSSSGDMQTIAGR